jgi:hypothetical protein
LFVYANAPQLLEELRRVCHSVSQAAAAAVRLRTTNRAMPSSEPKVSSVIAPHLPPLVHQAAPPYVDGCRPVVTPRGAER